jgi:hypothetical protein
MYPKHKDIVCVYVNTNAICIQKSPAINGMSDEKKAQKVTTLFWVW